MLKNKLIKAGFKVLSQRRPLPPGFPSKLKLKTKDVVNIGLPAWEPWTEEAILEDLVEHFGKSYKKEIMKSLDIDKNRNRGYGYNQAEFTVNGETYILYEDEESAEAVATKEVESMLASEPEMFSESFIESHLVMTETYKRMYAQDEADARMDGMRDKDILQEADMESEYEEAERVKEIEGEIESKKDDMNNLADPEDDDKDEWKELEEEIQELQDELDGLDKDKSPDDILEAAKETLNEKYYEEIKDALDDPVQYFIRDSGMYSSVKELIDAGLVSLDEEEAAKEAVSQDGWEHYLSKTSGEYDTTDHGYVFFKE